MAEVSKAGNSSGGFGPFDNDRNALRRGHEATCGMVPEGDQRIAFGVIAAEASFRNVVGVHDEAVDAAHRCDRDRS